MVAMALPKPYRLLIAALAATAMAQVSAARAADDLPQSLSGPAEVRDGQTLGVADHAVRLAGIDGPDPAQTCRWSGRTIPCGTIAGDALRDLITGAEVRCRIIGGTADRLIGTCQADGFDIGGNMVYTGWAVTAPDGPERYRETQAQAKAARRGLWRGEFVMPEDWRAGKRLP